MTGTSTRRSRYLAAFGAAVVTVGIIAAASIGYDAWRSGGGAEDPAVAEPTTTVTPSPTESTTEQAPPEDEPDGGTDGEDEEPPQRPPGDEDGSGEGDQSEPAGPPEWKRVLDGFAHDFNRATGSRQKWQQRMARWVTPHLAEAYKSVDPRLLPNTSIDSTEIQSEGSEAVTAVIHYRGIQPVWVHLQPTPDGWRVTEAEPYTGG